MYSRELSFLSCIQARYRFFRFECHHIGFLISGQVVQHFLFVPLGSSTSKHIYNRLTLVYILYTSLAIGTFVLDAAILDFLLPVKFTTFILD